MHRQGGLEKKGLLLAPSLEGMGPWLLERSWLIEDQKMKVKI